MSVASQNSKAVHAIKEIKGQFRNNSLPVRIPNVDRYNCWGFVAFYFKWIPQAEWLDCDEMEEMLTCHTKAVTKPRNGDIVVFRKEDGFLTHTAVMLDKTQETVCHKPGYDPLCVESVHDVVKYYLYGQPSFRRLVPKVRSFA